MKKSNIKDKNNSDKFCGNINLKSVLKNSQATWKLIKGFSCYFIEIYYH